MDIHFQKQTSTAVGFVKTPRLDERWPWGLYLTGYRVLSGVLPMESRPVAMGTPSTTARAVGFEYQMPGSGQNERRAKLFITEPRLDPYRFAQRFPDGTFLRLLLGGR
jgi:hypothetical protein